MSSVVTLAFLLAAPAQMRLPGDASAERFLKEDARVVSRRILDGATTLAEWQAKLPRLRREYLDMLGLHPLPERTPLHATVTGTVERDTVTIEKLHFQSKPGLYVTANLYRPKDAKGKLPTILYVCGHSGRGRDGNKVAFQDHGMWFARNGYVCLLDRGGGRARQGRGARERHERPGELRRRQGHQRPHTTINLAVSFVLSGVRLCAAGPP